MRHRHSGIPTYGLSGQGKGDEHPAYAPLKYNFTFNFTFSFISVSWYVCCVPVCSVPVGGGDDADISVRSPRHLSSMFRANDPDSD